MKNKFGTRPLLVLVLIMVIHGACASKKPPQQIEQSAQPISQPAPATPIDPIRQQGLAELRKIRDAIDGLRIVVEGGVSLDEFSRRFTDSLLKIGDLEMSKQQTLAKFPEGDRSSVAEIYGHFQNAIDAYKESKRFFGGPGEGLGESDFSTLTQRFPLTGVQSESDSVTSSHRYYPAPGILNSLWQYATQENQSAAASIGSLDSR